MQIGIAGGNDLRELLLRKGVSHDRVVGEGGEPAVGAEQHAVFAEGLDGSGDARHHVLGRLERLLLLVQHPDAHPLILADPAQRIQASCARRGQLERERAHVERGEQVDEGGEIALERR